MFSAIEGDRKFPGTWIDFLKGGDKEIGYNINEDWSTLDNGRDSLPSFIQSNLFCSGAQWLKYGQQEETIYAEGANRLHREFFRFHNRLGAVRMERRKAI